MQRPEETRKPRPGEELDENRLRTYLEGALSTPVPSLQIEQFPGGHSNLTYLVRLGERELVLRRPPFGSQVKSAHDMGREYRILTRLSPAYPRVPRPVLFCEDESVLGARFYLMERLHGTILRRKLPAGLTLSPETMARLCGSFVDTLVELHGVDHQAVGLLEFGNPAGYVERQISGWTRRYADARTDEVPEMDAVASWLAGHMPASPAPAIVHNDFKFDNLVLDPGDLTRVTGILDWEMSTIGDPLTDLGTALCYWVEAGDPPELQMASFGPTNLPGCYTRRQLVARYAEKSGRDLSEIVFYYCLGLFKSAVVAQQIYYRYVKGLTRDDRFGMFGQAAVTLVRRAAAQMGRRDLVSS